MRRDARAYVNEIKPVLALTVNRVLKTYYAVLAVDD
jgi:hypothetical protein